MYVFGKKDVDISHCVEESLQNLPEALEVTLKHDVAYSHVAGKRLYSQRPAL